MCFSPEQFAWMGTLPSVDAPFHQNGIVYRPHRCRCPYNSLDFCVHVQINKLDFLVWLVAFVVTCFAGVEKGLAVSVGLSLVLVLLRVGFPHTAVLGKAGPDHRVQVLCWLLRHCQMQLTISSVSKGHHERALLASHYVTKQEWKHTN